MIMSKISNSKLPLVLLVVMMSLQTGCARVIYKNAPPWPTAGTKTADELVENCPRNKCPDVWNWLGRLDKLHDQLEAGK